MISVQLTAQDTPLLDRELFFGNPEISGGQLSPDGAYITFLKEYEGIMNIWIKKFDESFDSARPLTDSERPLSGYFWTFDGKYVVFAKDDKGDENLNVFAVDPYVQPPEGQLPEARNLTPLDEVSARIYTVSEKDPDKMMVGLNDRDKAWHDLYELTISTGNLELVYENTDRITGYNFDWDEALRAMYRTDEAGNTVMLYKTDDGLKEIYATTVDEGAGIIGWNKDNSRLYLETNKGDIDLSTVFLMDPETGEMELFEQDPEGKADFGSLFLSRITREPIRTSYTDNKTRYYWRSLEWESHYQFLKEKFPNREISISSLTKDYQKALVAVWGDKYASESWYFDRYTRELIHQYTPRPALKEVEDALSPMTAIRYKSSDGLEIPAYLTIPAGTAGKDLPTVILVHGGPKGPRDYWGYDATAQFLANRGYAVLQPNFRASGGYGKAFLNAGDKQWGKLMQDDITWGVQHLIDEGIAAADKVAIMGGSYGGYATLAGLTFTPDLYACGVDIVGPSNLFTLLESIPAYWEAGRAFLYAMVGDPDTDEGQKLLREASPLFYADKIVKPLLIVQGANDPRVKQAEADQIVIALRDKGKKIDYLLAEDEGHGFRKPVNRMAMYAEVERFLADVIGGRFQEDMPDDVEQRLEELRVDISTVTYEPKGTVTLATELPALTPNVHEGVYNYDFVLEVQGQKMEGDMVRSISKQEGKWLVKDVSTLPMGESSDEITLGVDLQPISRSMQQMGQQIQMTYAADKVTLLMAGNEMAIPTEGPRLSDGPALDLVVGAMPLEVGFATTLLSPDMTTMKAKTVHLHVDSMDEMGGVSYYKVAVENTDNEKDVTHLWIHPETRMAHKMSQVIPAMGNAKMVMTMK